MSETIFTLECLHDVISVSFAHGIRVTPALIVEVIARENDLYDVAQHNAIWNFNGCLPSDDFGYDALERIIHYITGHPEIQWNPRLAIVVDADVQYGLSRMFQSLVDNYPMDVRIFYDEQEAWAWLAGEESTSARQTGKERSRE